jgi:penicillin-binding protein 1B
MASRRPRGAKRPPLRRRLLWAAFSLLVIAICVGGLLFAAYLIRLDGEIRTRFAGARWALPAQVYAAPLELYPGARMEAGGLVHELRRLGYRALTSLEGPGTFVERPGGRIDVHARAFEFWDGPQTAAAMIVQFTDGTLSGLSRGDTGAPLNLARLDPMLIGSIYPQQGEDRVLVRLDEVPDLLPQGLMAVEDRGFYRHFGISPKGITRAFIANLQAGRVVQGGSTLTQQLVKNFFLDHRQTWARKINEAFMALLLEAHYEKDEILEAYLNEVNLGQDGGRSVNGFGLGAQFYFNKPLAELMPHEIALLVGLVKGPSFYNPRRNPERALDRRNLVLRVFADDGLIDAATLEAAVARPLDIAGGRDGGVERYPAFVDLVKRQLRLQYEEEDLTREGLRIFTTLNPRAQEVLEAEIVRRLPDIERSRRMDDGTLEAAGVVTNVEGGEVLALVGGRKVRYPGFNRALDARRSIGSLAKPFVYLTALARPADYNLYSWLADEPVEVKMAHGPIWRPQNYDKQLHGPQPLYAALAQSYNLPTVNLGLAVGAGEVMKTFRAAGYRGDAPVLPSIFLGAIDIAPLDVAQMYATLAAGGFQAPLSAIREVLTEAGEPLSRYPLKVRQALPEGPVYLVNWALEQVMRSGTGRGAYREVSGAINLAGKSGTTDDFRDAWFAGFGGDRVAVVWVGRDDNKSVGLSGSSGALPIWAGVMKGLNVQSRDPFQPATVEAFLIDPATGQRADEGCAATVAVPYLVSHPPAPWAPCANAAVPETPLDWFMNLFQRTPEGQDGARP